MASHDDSGNVITRDYWYRRVGFAGSSCDMHHRLATLAHNLALAAALELAARRMPEPQPPR